MIVYRLEAEIQSECRKGEWIGPFTAAIYDDRYTSCTSYWRDTLRGGYIKEPLEDGIHKFTRGMVCGVLDFAQLMNWGTRWGIERLMENGFRLAIYDVPDKDVYIGDSQVVWYPSHATYIGNTDMFEMRDIYKSDRHTTRKVIAEANEYQIPVAIPIKYVAKYKYPDDITTASRDYGWYNKFNNEKRNKNLRIQ